MADQVRLSPESFRTLYLRTERGIILTTEAGRRIIIERIIGSDWTPYRIYEGEKATNDNKREIFLIDKRYVSQVSKELKESLNNGR